MQSSLLLLIYQFFHTHQIGQRFLLRHGFCVQKALDQLDPAPLCKRRLFPGLHPFGDHPDARLSKGARHRFHQSGAPVVVEGRPDQAAVDLDHVHRQMHDIRQIGVAGAEIVQRELHALFASFSITDSTAS